MSEAIVNGRKIVSSDTVQTVTVLKRPDRIFGAAVPIADKTFSSPEDGPWHECLTKAVEWAKAN